MKIKFLGTGSAFTLLNWQTNMLIEKNNKTMLIDAGGDIRHSLAESGMSYKNIDSVYVSHLHFDHVSGLEYLGFCSWFDPTFKTSDKIALYGNGDLLRKAWDKCLSGSMESIQGRMMELGDYFDVKPVRPNDGFVWEGIEFQLVQTVHVYNGYVIVPSYGLIATDPCGKKVFFTCDTQHAPNQIKDFYNMADIIIQDCETSPYCSGVHANYTELRTLPADIKAKMFLVHMQDNVLEGRYIEDGWATKLGEDGFKLMATRQTVIDVEDF